MPANRYRSPVFEDLKHSEQEALWRKVTAPLLIALERPRSIDWIMHWATTNLPGRDYVNALAWLSIHDLITPCYNEGKKPHWVTIQNVPYGWTLHQPTQPALISRRIKKADLQAIKDACKTLDEEDAKIATENAAPAEPEPEPERLSEGN